MRSHRETGTVRPRRLPPHAHPRERRSAALRLDDLVTVVDAHAAEIVVDEHGDSWVSHCGWGQGGVFLAPLSWS